MQYQRDLIATLPGTQVLRQGTRGWVTTCRGLRSIGGSSFAPLEDVTVIPPVLIPGDCCPAAVWLDGVPIYRGGVSGSVTNVNRFAPTEVEAVEYYAGPAQTPAEYVGLHSCGVVVIHTRRQP